MCEAEWEGPLDEAAWTYLGLNCVDGRAGLSDEGDVDGVRAFATE